MNDTKTGRFLASLQDGNELTAAQAESRFGLQNVRAAASHLRHQGFAIYANRRTDTRGRQTTKYRLGTPTRSVIAAGYRSQA